MQRVWGSGTGWWSGLALIVFVLLLWFLSLAGAALVVVVVVLLCLRLVVLLLWRLPVVVVPRSDGRLHVAVCLWWSLWLFVCFGSLLRC